MNEYLAKFDEINRLLRQEYDFEELCDLLYAEMKNAFEMGYKGKYDDGLLEMLIFISYNGKDVFDLLGEAYGDKDEIRIKTIFENEFHRMYNAGCYEGAQGKYTTKTWVTMGDDKVRDTHSYLEGIEIPIDAEFITFDGDGAQYPGGFSDASNNVNCRCVLDYK